MQRVPLVPAERARSLEVDAFFGVAVVVGIDGAAADVVVVAAHLCPFSPVCRRATRRRH
jgi:hypothetical protein